MDYSLSDEQKERRKEFFKVCQELEKSKPKNFLGMSSVYGNNEGWEYHLYCAKEFAKKGWLSLNWPTEYGGNGNMMDRVLFSEARGYFDVPGVDGFGVAMLAPTLLNMASEEIRRKFLPKIAAAEVMWCQTWSEPNAGSDLASCTTTAVRKGDEYVINGQKSWSSGAHRAQWGFGVFKSDLEGPKHRNLSFLLFDMHTPGITLVPVKYMDGTHVYNDVYFDNVHVPVNNIVGNENGGWAVVNVLASFERSRIDEVMRMQRRLEDLVNYCNTTTSDGNLLSANPIIRNKLAQIACDLEASRTLAYYVADLQNRGEMSLMHAAGSKVFASELGERFASLATDILGAHGQVKASKWAPLEGQWEKLYQDHFVFTISMGTNEIQRNIIAWYGLDLPRMK